MSDDLWLAFMSVGLVAPAMLALLYITFSGRLGHTEDARYLPIMDPEHDFWDTQEDPEARERGSER